MGCGISKGTQRRLQAQSQKIDELIELNGQMAVQIAELKDLKNKRKPIYVVYDQEIDDLYVFKTELDKKFVQLEEDIDRIQKFIEMQPAPIAKKKKRQTNEMDDLKEDDFIKMMKDDNDITIKPFDVGFDQLEINQEEQEQPMRVLDDLVSDKQEATLPKPQSKQEQRIAEILDDQDIRQLHDGIKNKLFKDSDSGLQINQIILEPELIPDKEKEKEKEKEEIIAPQTEKQKSKKRNSTQPKSSTQQQFFTKQNTAKVTKRI